MDETDIGTIEITVDRLGPRLAACVDRAFERYRQNYLVERRKVLCETARAFILRDLIIDEMMLDLVATRGIEFIEKRNIKLFVVDGFLVRVKRLDANLNVRYHPTVSSWKYHNQLPLFGFPALDHLYLGYVLDPWRTAAERVLLVHPALAIDDRWHVDLRAASNTQVELFPSVEVEPRTVSRVRVIAEDSDASVENSGQ